MRSLEDYFRKIEIAENRINEICKEELMQFQSAHPSKQLPAGRGSHELLNFILIMSIGILSACCYLFWGIAPSSLLGYTYVLYGCVVAVYIVVIRISFNKYSYLPQSEIT